MSALGWELNLGFAGSDALASTTSRANILSTLLLIGTCFLVVLCGF